MGRKKTGRPRGRPRKNPQVPPPDAGPAPGDLHTEDLPRFAEAPAAAPEPAPAIAPDAVIGPPASEAAASEDDGEAEAAKAAAAIDAQALALAVSEDSLAYQAAEEVLTVAESKVLPKLCGFLGYRFVPPPDRRRRPLIKAGAVILHTEVGLDVEKMSPRDALKYAAGLYLLACLGSCEALPPTEETPGGAAAAA